MISQTLFQYYYPASRPGGTAQFYGWIGEYLTRDAIVLNAGAGDGSSTSQMSFKGGVKTIVGIDIDADVLNNKFIDQAIHLQTDQWPFRDEYFDLTYCDYVFEHLENPGIFLKESYRTLKKGGSLFFRTPNKCHYVSLIARATPHSFHEFIANKVRGFKEDAHKPHPTYYRMNCEKEIRRWAVKAGFQEMKFRLVETEPSYLVFHEIPFILGVAYERIVNRFEGLKGLRANIFGRLIK